MSKPTKEGLIRGTKEAFGRASEAVVEGTKKGAEGLSRWFYEKAVLPGRTSWAVTEFDDGTPPDVRKNANIRVFTMPFNWNGRWYPALKKNDVLRDYDPNFPHFKLLFDEGRKDIKGDEIIMLIPCGALVDEFHPGAADISWKLFMPGKETIATAVGAGGKPITMNTADMTAADVVRMFALKVDTASQHRVRLEPQYLYDAMGALLGSSDSLKYRWEMLKGRLEFQAYVMQYPEVVSLVLYSMAPSNAQDFAGFVSAMRNGELKTWTDVNEKLDQVSRLQIEARSGSVMGALLLQGLTVNSASNPMQEVMEFPPSVLISYPGLTFINAVMKGYENQLQLVIAQIAARTVESQEEALRYIEDLQREKTNTWKAARLAIKNGMKDVKGNITAKVLQQLALMEKNVEQMIEGRVPELTAQLDGSLAGLTKGVDPIKVVMGSGGKPGGNAAPRGPQVAKPSLDDEIVI